MSKPKRTNGSDYFQHDYNARSDVNILSLRAKYGALGYGIYWMLIEKLAEANGYLLLSKLEAIAYELQVDEKILNNVIFCFDLFETDSSFACSARLNKQLKYRGQISKLRQVVGKLGGEANAKQLVSKRQAIGNILKERKGKERKGKETYGEFVFLFHEEVEKLKVLMGSEFDERVQSLNDYIGSTGKKYSSHYHTLLSWWRKDHPREKSTREIVEEFMKNPNNLT